MRILAANATAPTLSVVVPAYNEAARLPPTLAQIRRHLDGRGWSYEIIVVDDGSSDRTAASVRALAAADPRLTLLRHPINRGKGAAVRTGVLASRGELVLFSDADLSTPIEELDRMCDALAQADMAIGSRALVAPDVQRRQRLSRRLVGRVFNLLLRLVGGAALRPLRDTQCGFKLFRGRAARALFAEATIDGFAFDVELLLLAHRRLRVCEVPVSWHDAPGSKVSVASDSLRMLRDVLRLRLRARRNRRSFDAKVDPCNER